MIGGEMDGKKARDHKVYCLNLKANKILPPQKLEKVFFDSDLESRRLEDFWTKLEKKEAYQIYKKVIKKSDISNNYEKAMISNIIYQMICRNSTYLKEVLGKENFIGEVEKITKTAYLSLDTTVEFMEGLSNLHWVLYQVDEHTFPLTDSFVCGRTKFPLFVALSPRLLLEIKLDRSKGYILKKRGVNYSKLKDYQKHAIESSCREIIFSDYGVLEEWKNSKYYLERRKELGYEIS